jgi:chromosome transmission fidelity protein 8
MSTVHIYPPRPENQRSSPLPQLLQTPSGVALLELQGTFNLPESNDDGGVSSDSIEIGKLDFPDYKPGVEGSAWMKRVHMYVGQHQRLTGEVKKLPKAIAIVQRRGSGAEDSASGDAADDEDLEIVEVVKYKIIFSNRPEPVGTAQAD